MQSDSLILVHTFCIAFDTLRSMIRSNWKGLFTNHGFGY